MAIISTVLMTASFRDSQNVLKYTGSVMPA